jgi:uroporphyrinogen-III synthase
MTNALRLLALKALDQETIARHSNAQVIIDQQEVIRLSPHFKTEEVDAALKTCNQLIFTSFEAVKAIRKLLIIEALHGKRILCIGDRSANFFRQFNLEVIQAENATALTHLILTDEHQKTAYFHGNRSLDIVPDYCATQQHALKTVEVYHCELTCPKINAIDSYQIILFYSPSGVESFLQHNRIPENTFTAAIGSTTAAAVPNTNTWIASKANTDTLIQESIQRYTNYVNNL